MKAVWAWMKRLYNGARHAMFWRGVLELLLEYKLLAAAPVLLSAPAAAWAYLVAGPWVLVLSTVFLATGVLTLIGAIALLNKRGSSPEAAPPPRRKKIRAGDGGSARGVGINRGGDGGPVEAGPGTLEGVEEVQAGHGGSATGIGVNQGGAGGGVILKAEDGAPGRDGRGITIKAPDGR